MAALICEHSAQKSNAIHFHTCNPALWDLSSKIIRVFDSIWRYNVKIRS